MFSCATVHRSDSEHSRFQCLCLLFLYSEVKKTKCRRLEPSVSAEQHKATEIKMKSEMFLYMLSADIFITPTLRACCFPSAIMACVQELKKG